MSYSLKGDYKIVIRSMESIFYLFFIASDNPCRINTTMANCCGSAKI